MSSVLGERVTSFGHLICGDVGALNQMQSDAKGCNRWGSFGSFVTRNTASCPHNMTMSQSRTSSRLVSSVTLGSDQQQRPNVTERQAGTCG